MLVLLPLRFPSENRHLITPYIFLIVEDRPIYSAIEFIPRVIASLKHIKIWPELLMFHPGWAGIEIPVGRFVICIAIGIDDVRLLRSVDDVGVGDTR